MAQSKNSKFRLGDVTSTMACAITALKSHTKVAHMEGGIRFYDWTMPEEINRLVTDASPIISLQPQRRQIINSVIVESMKNRYFL